MDAHIKYKLALGLGIGSIPFIFIFIGIGALPSLFVGIILSIQLLKDKQKNALIPLIISSIGFLIALIITIIFTYFK